jgi:hypothetical protein
MSYKLIFSLPVLAAIGAVGYNYAEANILNAPASVTQPNAPVGSSMTTSIKDTNIQIGNKYGQYTYDLAPKRQTMTVTETSAFVNKPSIQGGGFSQFLYFDMAATRKFERQVKNTSQCPASFFNRHNNRISLFATAPHIKAKIAKWDNVYWKDTSRWYKTVLVGRCITGSSSFFVRGEDKTSVVNPRTFSNCSHFYVESIVSRKPYETGS